MICKRFGANFTGVPRHRQHSPRFLPIRSRSRCSRSSVLCILESCGLILRMPQLADTATRAPSPWAPTPAPGQSLTCIVRCAILDRSGLRAPATGVLTGVRQLTVLPRTEATDVETVIRKTDLVGRGRHDN